jgi:murein DD-endopeptidase MepM/ murein hydrolase activator NlpD
MDDFDIDLRGGQYDTTDAAQKASRAKPTADERGVISYPTYQVVEAREGDTVGKIAARLNTAAGPIARYNGLQVDEPLAQGTIIALPQKLADAPVAQAEDTPIDVTELANTAIENAQTKDPVQRPPNSDGIEPIRHKVVRGETAFTISRLYNVTVSALAEWNNLDGNLTVREEQYLLIPLPVETAAPVSPTSTPGAGSATPAPPSSTTPLPEPEPEPEPEVVAKPEPKPEPVATPSGGRMGYPVKGKIIREYAKGKTDGIDISSPAGTTVVAAMDGVVAAVTMDVNQVPIVVVKHADNLLTVYANLSDIMIAKGDNILRGQGIAKVPSGTPSYVHFEVRKGLESVDPMDYLN